MIEINELNPSDAIANGPSVINGNLRTIKSHIDNLEDLLNPTNKTIRLTQLTTLSAGGIEASALALTNDTGQVFSVSPGGGAVTASIDSSGNLSVNKVVARGNDETNRSEFAVASFSGAVGLNGQVNVNNLISLTGDDARVATKYRILALSDANMGQSATTKVDISKDKILFFNYSAVTVSDGINIDTTNIADGQEFELYCLRNSGTGSQVLENGISGQELFAYIDPASNGFVTISSTTKPAFSPAVSPAQLSFMKVKWMNIGGGTFRFVILDYKQMTGVN